MQIISLYQNETHSKNGFPYDIDLFFNDILTGKYKDKVNEIRLAKYNFKLEDERLKNSTKEDKLTDEKYQKAKLRLKELKGNIARACISGRFKDEGRSEANLIQHSGLIDIDIDKLESTAELEILKAKLINDKFTFACFTTCGGDGLSWICRIDTSKVNESWEGIKSYLFDTYNISIDTSHKNVANTRNASWDEQCYVADKLPPKFNKFPKKTKPVKIRQDNFIYVKNDFENIIREIIVRRIDFCPDYEIYRNIGFSIASQFGEQGFEYFDSICQFNEKYNKVQIEKDYKFFCKNPNGGIKIASFYWRCKDLGIETKSPLTQRVSAIASAAKRGGKTASDTIKNLVKFEGLREEDCNEIVNEVFDRNLDIQDDSNEIITLIETYISHNHDLKKNLITGKLDDGGREWDEEDLNGLYTSIKKVHSNADAKWIERTVFSPFIKRYNPVREWFINHEHLMPDELLDKGEIPSVILKLWDSVQTSNPKFTVKYGTKWLVSVISAIFGTPSNLEFGFTGKLHKGKTWFFEHLLPPDLIKYFAESKLDAGKDDWILMCQKILILMNEAAGKTRNDEKVHKSLLDKNVFSLRRPYRKDNEDIVRLAVLCFTSNPINVLGTDPHGNRRVIPINVLSRNYAAYDAINKDELWMAVYWLWKQGFKWRIDESEIPELSQATLGFRDFTQEYEMITKYYDKGGIWITASEIKVRIDKETNQKLSLGKITDELRSLEFESIQDPKRGNMYKAMWIEDSSPALKPFPEDDPIDYFK